MSVAARCWSRRTTAPAPISRRGRELVDRGVPVIAAGVAPRGAIVLPTLDADPVIQPLLLAQSGYRLIAQLAAARGLDPDRPAHLCKVTETR